MYGGYNPDFVLELTRALFIKLEEKKPLGEFRRQPLNIKDYLVSTWYAIVEQTPQANTSNFYIERWTRRQQQKGIIQEARCSKQVIVAPWVGKIAA